MKIPHIGFMINSPRKMLLAWVFFTALLFGLILWSFLYFRSQRATILTKKDQINQIAQYLVQEENGVFPYPRSEVFYFDKDGQFVFPESSQNLSGVETIQWTLCWLEDRLPFERSFLRDNEFTTQSSPRCFTYAVSADQQRFSLAWIVTNWPAYETYMTWNASLIRDYNAASILEQGDRLLPYLPWDNSSFVIKSLEGNPDIYFEDDQGEINFPEGVLKNLDNNASMVAFGSYGDNITVRISGKNSLSQIIFSNGTKLYIHPQEDSFLEIQDASYNSVVLKLLTWSFALYAPVTQNAADITVFDAFGNTVAMYWWRVLFDESAQQSVVNLQQWALRLKSWKSSYLINSQNPTFVYSFERKTSTNMDPTQAAKLQKLSEQLTSFLQKNRR